MIEITPRAADYQQLCRDLKVLRRSGAASNTDAILQAVHERAERAGKIGKKSTGRRSG